MEIIDTSTPEAFHAARKGRIGSSDIAAICGLNPYRSPLRVFLEMTGKVEPDEENRPMRLGKKREQEIADEFGLEHPGIAIRKPLSTWVKDFAIATPDRLLGAPVSEILECKAASSRMRKLWEEGIPWQYQCQVQWQMGIVEVPSAWIACIIDWDYIEYPLTYNQDVFDQLYGVAERFMERIKSDTPPEPQPEDSDIIKKMFQLEEGKEIELSAEAEEKAWALMEARKTAAAADKEKKRLETWMRLAMGNASIGMGSKYRVKLTPVHKAPYMVGEQNYTMMKVEEL